MEIYKQPLYYEIAFSFIDAKEQVDNFEKIIKKFSKIKVNRFLDIACGPSLQLREIARRGYEAIGLDLHAEMLAYLKKKAKEEKVLEEKAKIQKEVKRIEKVKKIEEIEGMKKYKVGNYKWLLIKMIHPQQSNTPLTLNLSS